MRFAHRAVLGSVLIASIAAGCAGRDAASGTEDARIGAAASALLWVSAPATPAEACTARVWVGATQDKLACPSAAPTPGAGGTWLSEVALSGEAGFVGLCVYRWSGASDPTPSLGALPSDAGRPWSEWLSPDCHVAAPLAHPGDGGAWLSMRQELQRAAGGGATIRSAESADDAVLVAVIDSSPDSALRSPALGRSAHGATVGHVLADLVCARDDHGAPLGTCLGVRTVLGLPNVAPDEEDLVNGGYFGSQLSLARAVMRAVDDYRADHVGKKWGSRPPRLVLNVSAGWEPSWGGAYEDAAPDDETRRKMPGPAFVVREALRHARCWGAVVVAAAGNEPGGTQAQGIMLPAAWQQNRAPTHDDCAKLEGAGWPGGIELPLTDDGALVVAAGGVDAYDRPLANARAGAPPLLVAVGERGVGTIWSGPPGSAKPFATDALTGTSISAAVTSAAIALAWAGRPDLSPSDVVDVVRGSGVSLHRPDLGRPRLAADGVDGKPGGDVRRVSVCRAALAVCKKSRTCKVEGCVVPPAYATPETLDDDDVARFEADGGYGVANAKTLGPLGPLALVTPQSPCDGSLLTASTGGTSFPCPLRQAETPVARPWVLPQPTVPDCPSCGVMLGYDPIVDEARLYLFLEGPYAGQLESPVLTYQLADGSSYGVDLSYVLPYAEVGVPYMIGGLPPPPQGADSAQITFATRPYRGAERVAVPVPLPVRVRRPRIVVPTSPLL